MHEALIELKLFGFKCFMMVLLMMEERVQKETDEAENHFGHVKKAEIHIEVSLRVFNFRVFSFQVHFRKDHVLKMKAKYC